MLYPQSLTRNHIPCKKTTYIRTRRPCGCKAFAHCQGKVNAYGENSLELCSDKSDNDGDAMVDCADPECSTYKHCLGSTKSGESSEADCKNGQDDDGDGYIDCAEGACQQFSHCQDACPEDPFKFASDQCACGETLMEDDTCARNIDSKEDLLAYAQDHSKNAVLKRDIDLGNNNAWKPIGTAFTPYKAKFYGSHKRIGGVLQCAEGTMSCGLFGVATNASFKDLTVAVSLTNDTKSEQNIIGGLLGYGINVKIQGMKVPAKVVAKVSEASALEDQYCKAPAVSGALAGTLSNSEVIDVQVTGSSTAQSKFNNQVIAGGVIGMMSKSLLSKVQSNATTTAYLDIAGSLPTKEVGCTDVLAGGVVGLSDNSTISEVVYNTPVKAYTTGGVAAKEWGQSTLEARTYNVIAGGAVARMKGGKAEKLRGNGIVEAVPDDSSYTFRAAAGGVVGFLDKGVINIASFKGSAFAKGLSELATERYVYTGGIVAKATGDDKTAAELFNVQAEAKLTGQSTYWQASGGLAGHARYCNVSNSLAKSTFYSYKRADKSDNYLGGLIGDARDTKLVNTYAKADVHVEEGTETDPVNQPVVGSLVSKSQRGYLYDSYWSKRVAPSIINVVVGTLVDTSCLEYTNLGEGASAKPEVMGDSLLTKLRKNLGLDSGVVSPNIPKSTYLPWIEKSDVDGKWPMLDFDATSPISVGL